MNIDEKSSEIILTILPHSSIVVNENTVCVVINGKIKTKLGSSLSILEKGTVFKSIGAIYGLNVTSQIAALDPKKHKIPKYVTKKLLNNDKYPKQHIVKSPNDMLYESETSCPVCLTTFKIIKYFESKLVLLERDHELRSCYDGVNQLYYDVYVCPQCFYGNHRLDFNALTDKAVAILTSNPRKKDTHQGILNLNEAINNYKIALECLAQIDAPAVKQARLWLHLAWLYDDANDKNSAASARQKAKMLYDNIYMEGNYDTKNGDMILYILGELSYQLGEYKIAYHRLHHFLLTDVKDKQIIEMAQCRIEDVKEARKR